MIIRGSSRSRWPSALDSAINEVENLKAIGEEALGAIHTMAAVLADFYDDHDEEDDLYPTSELEKCAGLLQSAANLVTHSIRESLQVIIDECSNMHKYLYANRPQPDYDGDDDGYY